MAFLKIENKSIYYKFVNKNENTENKPIIIFLHDGLGSVAQWKDFPEILCKKLNVSGLLYDRYGHGKSEALQEKRDVFFLNAEAKFLAKFIEDLKIKNKIILFGHSDGATISLLFSGMYPQKIKAVISEAHHVVIEEMVQKGIIETVEDFKNGKLKSLLEKYHGDKTESMFYGWANIWLSNEAKKWTALDFLNNITAPVLAMQGNDDKFASIYQLKVIEFICPNEKETHLLENCKHIPHFQQQDKVIELTTNFLKL